MKGAWEVSENSWPFWRWFLFQVDAERTHEMAISLLRVWSFLGWPKLSRPKAEPKLSRTLMGIQFPNLLGLAAGFDINAECIPALQALGFGFIEVGGVTSVAQPGNPRPRIFRLPDDKALLNRKNFYNKGAAYVQKRLKKLRAKNKIKVPIGINIGKGSLVPMEEVPKEYVATFRLLADVVDYVVINVSCPNTLGLRSLQTQANLGFLLDAVCNENESRKKPVPMLLKLGPDLTNEEAMACAQVAIDYRLSGLEITNTTTKKSELSDQRDLGPGGISGQPLFERSTQLLRCVSADFGGRLALIGGGGIMDSQTALEKLNAGADLLQVYTGFIYGGPHFPKMILNQLLQHEEVLGQQFLLEAQTPFRVS